MNLMFDYLGPPQESGPLPAFIYLSISAEESLHLEPYCQPATLVADDWLRVFSFTLPGHDDNRDTSQAINYWAEQLRHGHDVLTPFIESSAQTIHALIKKEIIDSKHLAIGGLSRGALLAAHIASLVPSIKSFVGFAPMTKLSIAPAFAGLNVSHFDIENLVEKLMHLHHVRFYIGNRDRLVSTDACYSFIRTLTEEAFERNRRFCKPELVISAAIGRDGHGTSRETFQAGAQFIQEALRGGAMHYSVVIPIHNEEENIQTLIAEIEPVMASLGQLWELLCIDDGSTDSSLLILQKLCKTRPHMRILSFKRNYGQSSAFAAGFEHARGAFVITLDGDGQNDPSDIPQLARAIGDYDLVVGWRVNRRDPWSKRVISKFSNWVRSRVCKDEMHDTGCSLKIYRKEALKKIKMYKGMHRFLPALFRMEGLRVREIPVKHRERKYGVTKYHFLNRSIGPILDMLMVHWMMRRTLCHEVREEITHDQRK